MHYSIYVLGAQKNRLIETVLLSTHNIYFGLSIMYLKVSQGVKCPNFLCISVPVNCFDLSKMADPDEMQHDAAFHLGLRCLP